jgi:hypothetical protein
MWTDPEDEIVKRVYPEHGSRGVRKHLPHRTIGATNARAKKLRVRFRFAAPAVEPTGWGQPSTSLTEQLDCVRFRKWRYPVQPRQVWGKVA